MKSKRMYRYFLLVTGMLLQFCYGIAYVWSVFQPFAKERFTLDTASANMPFGIFLGLFPIGNIVGGYFQKKFKPTTIIITGSFLMCAGLMGTAYVPVNQGWLLNITYGVMAGFGCGCAYNTSLATIQKWFPDRRGMVTGLLICSSGLFGLIINPIAHLALAEKGFTGAMVVVAEILFFICIIFGWFMRKPPENYMKDYVPVVTVVSKKQYTVREMLKTKQYYVIAISMMLAVPAYFLINPMLMSLGVERGLTEAVALSGVMLVSIMNTSGRLIAPWSSDRLGRKRVLMILFVINMIAILFMTGVRGYFFLVFIALVAFSYGGFMGMYPTMSADYFGSLNNGINYGAVMLGYAISSISCPYLARALQATDHGTTITFIIAAGASLVGLVLINFLRKPE